MATVETIRVDSDVSGAISGFERLQATGLGTLGKLQNAGSGLVSVGQNMALMTAPIAVGFAAVGKIAGDFENSMQRLQAISGATGEQFEQLRNQAKELGSTTEFSAKQAGDAQNFLAMAGFEVNEVVEAMPGLLDLATAGQLDLARAADISSNVLTGYGFEAKDIGYVNDIMAKTATSANTNISQLGEAMKYAAPIAKSAGLSFTEASTIIGKLSDAGIQGSMAGTSLRGALSRLLKPTKETTETLNRLGITTLDSSGNMRSLITILGDLEASGASTADMLTIFGQEAGTGMSALLGQGSDSLQELKEKLDGAEGSATKMADTMRGGLQGQMASMQSALEGLAIAIADTGLLNMMSLGIDLLTKVVQAAAQLPTPILTIVTALGVVAIAIPPILIGVGSLISAIASISAAIPIVTAAFGGLTVVTAPIAGIFAGISLPVIGVLAAFAALGVAIGVLIAHWDKLPAPVHRATSEIKFAAIGIGQSIMQLPGNIAQLPSAIGAILGSVGARFTRFQAELNYQFARVKHAVTSLISSAWSAGTGFIKNFGAGISAQFNQLVSKFKEQLQRIRNLLPGSEPRDSGSPLARLGQAGTATLQNFAGGLSAAPAIASLNQGLGTVRDALTVSGSVAAGQTLAQAQRAPVMAAASSGGGGEIVYSPTYNISLNLGGATGDLNRQIEQAIMQALESRDREVLDLIDRARQRWRRG